MCDIWQFKPPPPIRCTFEDRTKVDFEVQKYLKLGIIENATHTRDEYISTIFPTPKKSDGVRIILNLKPLNKDIEYEHFKMENLKTAISLIEKDCFMASIDLKDAYYSVNIDVAFRKYLRFVWNGNLFQFTCLPNGLTSAPRWFTKLLKPLFSHLRSQGYVSVYYLDDIWVMGRNESDCLENCLLYTSDAADE